MEYFQAYRDCKQAWVRATPWRLLTTRLTFYILLSRLTRDGQIVSVAVKRRYKRHGIKSFGGITLFMFMLGDGEPALYVPGLLCRGTIRSGRTSDSQIS